MAGKRLFRPTEPLHYVSQMVLPTEEDCNHSQELLLLINVEIKHSSVLGHSAQTRCNLRHKCSLVWRFAKRFHVRVDRTNADCRTLCSVRPWIPKGGVGFKEVVKDQDSVAVAFGGTQNLKDHGKPSELRSIPRYAGDFPPLLQIRPPCAAKPKPSVPQSQLPSALSPHEEVPARVGSLRSRSKSARLQQAFGQRRPAAQKSKRMFSRPSDITPYSTYIYHSVAPSSICRRVP